MIEGSVRTFEKFIKRLQPLNYELYGYLNPEIGEYPCRSYISQPSDHLPCLAEVFDIVEIHADEARGREPQERRAKAPELIGQSQVGIRDIPV
jgi:hypothetical protein